MTFWSSSIQIRSSRRRAEQPLKGSQCPPICSYSYCYCHHLVPAQCQPKSISTPPPTTLLVLWPPTVSGVAQFNFAIEPQFSSR